MGKFTDSTGADGDPLQGAPTAGEQREAAFAEAAGGPVEGVVGLVVGGEDLPAGGLLDRCLDALACAVVAGVGQCGQVESGGGSVQRADDPASRATVRSCRAPGATSETQIGRRRGG